MSKFRVLNAGIAGVQHIDQTFPPDLTARLPGGGGIIQAVDPYWGGGEFIYALFTSAVRAKALCQFAPVYNAVTGSWQMVATEAGNVANTGRSVGVAVLPAAANTWGWVQVTGISPVNSTAAVAASLPVGLTAAGQVGAQTAGKQIMGALTVATAASSSLTKVTQALGTQYQANMANSDLISVANTDGWFVGGYVSGTGIAAGAVVTAIDVSETIVTLSAKNTAQVTGNATFTYNNGTVFFNVIMLQRPDVQGAIT